MHPSEIRDLIALIRQIRDTGVTVHSHRMLREKLPASESIYRRAFLALYQS